MFEQLEHKADLKYKVIANGEDNLFEEITDTISDAVFKKQMKKFDERNEINLNANSLEMLIHDFIEELLYIANSEYKMFAYSDLHYHFDDSKGKHLLKGYIGIKPVLRKDYDVEVKACSYSIDLKKKKENGNERYELVFILDI